MCLLMDGAEEDSRYMSNYAVNQVTRPKAPTRDLPQLHSHMISHNYVDEVEDEDEEAADAGSIRQNGDYVDNDDDTDNNSDYDDVDGEGYKTSDAFNLHRHPKKRKLKSLSSSFQLAPRLPLPPAAKSGGRNTLTDWSDYETFVLLDAWGKRYLQRGRKSLRSEEWQQVAEKVSRESKIERTDTQCRNRLDTLKKKYKKEKALLEHNRNANTKWVYFNKMDMLMVAKPNQQSYLTHANGLDETRGSPGKIDSQEGDDDDDDDDLDLLPPKKFKYQGVKVNGGSFKLLADSINKFSEIYEKIESGKRKQMVELEKMRMDFYKDLELQKKQIVDRARDEIARIRQGEYEENDGYGENVRG